MKILTKNDIEVMTMLIHNKTPMAYRLAKALQDPKVSREDGYQLLAEAIILLENSKHELEHKLEPKLEH